MENEVSDPSNPLLQKEREESNVDPGELIKGLVDVRARLDKVSQKEGRSRLVQEVLSHGNKKEIPNTVEVKEEGATTKVKDGDQAKDGVKELAEMDRRVGEVEKLIGSSSTSLDEVRPVCRKLLGAD